jgi:peptidoglycan hydrolase CwlO-like protein
VAAEVILFRNIIDWACVSMRSMIVILVIAAVPTYVQAQSRSTPKVTKGDAQKVATIISSDKIKTQAYCDIQKLAEQVAEANEKKDVGRVNELFEKIETLEKTIGPEYVALIDGVQDIAKSRRTISQFLNV